MKPRLLLLAAIAASLFVVGPIAESTAGPGYPSVLTIRATNPVFHGRVHLRKAGQHPRIARPCRTRRVVTLFWHHDGNTQPVGKKRTNRLGRWTIKTNPHHGRYFAEAKRRILPKRGHKVCERAVSQRIRIR
jgi:hypothetical protein